MNGFMRKAAATSLALGLAVGFAACGDDDDSGDDASGASTTTEGREEATSGGDFCDALVEFNTAVFQTDVADDASAEEATAAGDELVPLFERVEAGAPEELQATASELLGTLETLQEGDPSEFNADATFETYTGFVSDAVGDCGFESVDVTAIDYAFQDVPATVPAGTVAVNLTNEGTEEHEFVVFKLEEGETRTPEEILNDPAAQEEGPGEFVTAAFAPPGADSSTLGTLEAGDYLAVCFIPVGGAEDGPPHFTQGMVAEFSVE